MVSFYLDVIFLNEVCQILDPSLAGAKVGKLSGNIVLRSTLGEHHIGFEPVFLHHHHLLSGIVAPDLYYGSIIAKHTEKLFGLCQLILKILAVVHGYDLVLATFTVVQADKEHSVFGFIRKTQRLLAIDAAAILKRNGAVEAISQIGRILMVQTEDIVEIRCGEVHHFPVEPIQDLLLSEQETIDQLVLLNAAAKYLASRLFGQIRRDHPGPVHVYRAYFGLFVNFCFYIYFIKHLLSPDF